MNSSLLIECYEKIKACQALMYELNDETCCCKLQEVMKFTISLTQCFLMTKEGSKINHVTLSNTNFYDTLLKTLSDRCSKLEAMVKQCYQKLDDF